MDIENTGLNYSALHDFIIFDEKEILINFYDGNDADTKSFYYNKDIKIVQKLSEAYDELFNQGVDYKRYATFDDKLIGAMRKENLIN